MIRLNRDHTPCDNNDSCILQSVHNALIAPTFHNEHSNFHILKANNLLKK